ncbi:MAG: diguanylate cyclase [Chloroflexota bacterium]
MCPESALLDPLTGIYSRAALNQRLQEEVERARRYGENMSLALLDMDHFKSINDAFGHTRGDQVLVEFSARLSFMVRSSDIVFRYGGDEFVILLPHTDRDQATRLSERMLETLRNKPFHGDPPLSVSLSMGIACFPQDASTPQALFELADQRHYHAKRGGRDRVISEDPLSEVAPLLAEVSRLIERDQALQTLRDMLNVLPQHKRGVLQVRGAPGSGKSRFLREIHQAARLQGYIVLDIRGQPALRSRLYGAFSEALRGRNLPSVWEGTEAFSAAISQWIHDKGSAGLLVSFDDIADIDQSTLDFWRGLFFSSHFPRLLLVYTTSSPGSSSSLHLDAPLHQDVTLDALSPEGVHLWVRQSLQWEPSEVFVDWLHRQTEGWPRRIQEGLVHLIALGLLDRREGGWRVHRDMEGFPLRDWLERRLAAPIAMLPSGLADFVGREAELAELKQLIHSERLVTLLGPGGMGKSRLAVQAAAESLEAFSNGVYFVPLAAISHPSSIVPAIADALHYSFSGPQEPQEQLLAYLHAKEMLLILDNFENLREGASLLAQIFQRAKGVHLLVTSRERLGLPEEALYDLHGMPLPQNNSWEHLQRCTAVQLFLGSARRARADFVMTAENAPAVVRICELVEGMPLGLELAAAWVGSFSPQQIASQIESTAGFLFEGSHALPGQQRSLLAVFDSFWNLLSESEQITLCQLAVFHGGFRGQAGRQVAGASPFFLDGLVSKAYLHRTPDGRYEMHQLLWQYAQEKLGLYPEVASQARDRHCEHYTHMAYERQYALANDRQVLDEISDEIENLRAAWNWAVSGLRLASLGRSCNAMAQYFTLVGLLGDGQALFQQAVAHLQAALQSAPAEMQPADIQAMQRLLGWLLVNQVSFFKDLGMSGQAMALFEQAMQLARLCQDQYLELWVQVEWGRAVMVQDLKQARTRVEGALASLQQFKFDNLQSSEPALIPLDERFVQSLQAASHRLLGVIAARGDNVATARQHLENALQLQRLLGNRDDESNILNNLGLLADMDGKREMAREYFLQALQIKLDLGNQAGAARALHNLGFVCSHLGDYNQARQYYEQALAIWQDSGNWSSEGVTLNNLSEVTFLQRDILPAIEYAERAIGLHRQSGNKSGQGEAFAILGQVFQYLGDYKRAWTNLEAARDLYIESGDLDSQAWVWATLGLLDHILGDDQAALQGIRTGLKLAEELGNQSHQALALYNLGHVLANQVELEQAEQAFQQALELRQRTGESHLALEPLAGLAQVALLRSDLNQAAGYVNQILEQLAAETAGRDGGAGLLERVGDVAMVYWVCFQTLEMQEDQRAPQVLAQARHTLFERAARIGDDEMRRSFLEAVDVHSRLLDAGDGQSGRTLSDV